MFGLLSSDENDDEGVFLMDMATIPRDATARL